MPLTRVQFKPGVNRESTSFADEQGWFDSDLIRFRKGRPEKLGGWTKISADTLTGTTRSLHAWITLGALKLMGVGTNVKFYIEQGSQYNDITPVRATATLGTNPITTGSAGSGEITVTATGHGAAEGDYVTFSGATAVDGLTTADLNKEHIITQVVSGNSYKLDTGGSATSGSTAGGGTAVVAVYQIHVGIEESVLGPGWGSGYWGGQTLTYSQTTLDGGINDSVTSLDLTSASDFETASTTTSAAVAIVSTVIVLDPAETSAANKAVLPLTVASIISASAPCPPNSAANVSCAWSLLYTPIYVLQFCFILYYTKCLTKLRYFAVVYQAFQSKDLLGH